MSNNLNDKNSAEEIDLLQLFGFFEGKIKSFFRLIFLAIKLVFDVFISFLKIIQQNFIKIALGIIVAFALGYVYDMYKPKIYSSKMIVKPLFDSKFQLVTNITYYNELVKNQEIDKLSEIFKINKLESESLSGFEITDGPQSEKEKTRLYNDFMKSLDSVAAATVNYETFVDNINIYDASLYEIKVNSSKNDVFGRLSNGFKKTFNSDYSKENKKKKETIFKLKKASINKSLGVIDSLKNVYINELSKEKSQQIEVLGNTSFKIGEEEKETKEFELLQLQIQEQNKLTTLEEEAIEENQLFEVVSDFQLIGSVERNIFNKMKFMFPLAVFVLILLWILGYKFNKFVALYNTKD